jgi:hypothetical protein
MPIPATYEVFKAAAGTVSGLRAVLVETDGDYARADAFVPAMAAQAEVSGLGWVTVNQGLADLSIQLSAYFFEPNTDNLVDRFFAFDAGFVASAPGQDYGTGYHFGWYDKPATLEMLRVDAEMVIARARYTIHLYRSAS